MQRSRDAALAEAEKLRVLRPSIPRYSSFGDDNWRAIEAQRQVLDFDLTETQVYLEGWPDYVEQHALFAWEWMAGDCPDAPTENWLPLRMN